MNSQGTRKGIAGTFSTIPSKAGGLCNLALRCLVPAKPENVAPLIFILRGEKVLLSEHLAELYSVPVKALNQAVKRNIERFPEDFMFQLTQGEANAILGSRSQSVTLKRGQNLKYVPYAFTEQGIAMLSSVLRSPRAMERKYDEQFTAVFDAIKLLIADDRERKAQPKRRIGFHP